jgi:uncharacterized membrane protein
MQAQAGSIVDRRAVLAPDTSASSIAVPQLSSLSRANRLVDAWLPEVYLVIALIVACLYACITPPFFGTDEAAHSMRALEISHGTFIAHKSSEGQGDYLDSGFASTAHYFLDRVLQDLRRPYHDRQIPRMLAAEINDQRAKRWSGQSTFVSFPQTRLYPPTFYVPWLIGWRIGAAENFTIIHTLLLARICCLTFAVVIGWAALQLAKGCRLSLAAILLIPTTLSLVGICSQDPFIIACFALAVAILSRPLAQKRLFLFWELVLAGFLLCACGMARPPYAIFLFCLVLPAFELRLYDWKSLLPPLGVASVGIAIDAAWAFAVKPLGVLLSPGAHPAAQLQFLSSHPFQGTAYIFGGFLKAIPILASGIASAASSDVRPPLVLVFLVLCVVGIILLSERDVSLRALTSRILLISICIGCAASMAFANYLICTPPGAHAVDGLSFRYFIPLLLLGTFFCGLNIPALGSLRRPCFLALILLDASLPFIYSHILYDRGLVAAMRLICS